MTYQHLFGPVPSRRLGRSLGVDLVPLKTCSYNCIYCECGKTTHLTTERKEYVPTAEVISELDDCLAKHPSLDYVTFSGSGEPTLHSGIGKISDFLAERYPEYRVALLTNGSLFSLQEVREDATGVDVIVPSLDSADERTFRRIDRPHPSLSIEKIISGLEALREEFKGEIWLEIFVVPGLNDTETEIEALRKALLRIRPDRVDLNTLDRPGVVTWIRAASEENLVRFAAALDNPAVEMIRKPPPTEGMGTSSEDALDSIMQTIRRRPCTMEDLCEISGMRPTEISKYLRQLTSEGKVIEERGKRGVFFFAGSVK